MYKQNRFALDTVAEAFGHGVDHAPRLLLDKPMDELDQGFAVPFLEIDDAHHGGDGLVTPIELRSDRDLLPPYGTDDRWLCLLRRLRQRSLLGLGQPTPTLDSGRRILVRGEIGSQPIGAGTWAVAQVVANRLLAPASDCP